MAQIPSILDDNISTFRELPFPQVIDNSMLGQLRSCEGKAYYSFLENLSPLGTSVHLHAGGAFAHGVEHVRRSYYQHGKTAEEAIAIGVSELLKYYGDYECPPESAKSAERMAGALVYYFDTYRLDSDYIKPWTDGTSNGIEFSFSFPLPVAHPQSGDPILYAGRFDMLAEHQQSGALFVTDEKTATSLGTSWVNQWELDSQFTGYCAGARMFNKPVVGAIIRGVSILKTKYDTKEAIIYRPQWQIDRWYRQVVRDVNRLVEIWKGGSEEVNWKLDKSACGAYGGCAFKLLCASPNPDQWKRVNYEPRVWHPMLREEREEQLAAGQIVVTA